MNTQDLQQKIQIALNESIKWGRDNGMSNAYRSAYFCSRVGLLLPREPGSQLLHIGFDCSTHTKTSGEWLLDAVIAEIDGFFVKTIHVAMECESSTSMSEFARDFGKLLNVKSKTKIYLHGLNHSSTAGANNFICDRLDIAAKYIRSIDPGSKWFMGFWPSPKKVKNFPSLWDSFGVSEQYKHLARVCLFEFDGASFVPAT